MIEIHAQICKTYYSPEYHQAKKALGLQDKASPQPRLNNAVFIEKVFEAIKELHEVSKDQMVGATRKQTVVFCRMIFSKIIRERLRLNLSEIGRILGGRDHATAIHYIKKTNDFISNDEEFRTSYLKILNRANSTIAEMHS